MAVFAWIAIVGILYFAAFIAVARYGRDPSWLFGFAFRYSNNAFVDYVLALFFWPAYRVCRLLGVDRLHQPFWMPK
jgi:hypothetical protein